MIEAWANWPEKVPVSLGRLEEHWLPTGTKVGDVLRAGMLVGSVLSSSQLPQLSQSVTRHNQ